MDSDRADSKPTTTRRRFLAGMLVASGVVVAGCDPPELVRRVGRKTSRLLDPPVTQTKIGGGPEPSSFKAPAPSTTPPPFPDTLTLDYDVCVVGGGAAGSAAAVSAARMGAHTLLLEESFMLGGNTTRGLVNLDKVAYGGDVPLVRGFFREIVLGMEARGEAVYPTVETHFSVPYDADGLRRALLEVALAAGVDVRLGAQMARVTAEGRAISEVWAIEQGRPLDVRANTYIDCTGDGHLGYLAGNGYWLGDRNHGQVQGQTLIFYAGPVDFERLGSFATETGSLVSAYQVIGLRDQMAKAVANGLIGGTPQRGLLINRTLKEGVVSISGSETYRNHLEPGELSTIASELESQDLQIYEMLHDSIPGFEESSLARLAERPYLREGRRLIGYRVLTGDEVLAGLKPKDSIARGWYPIDLHVSYGAGTFHFGQVKGGDWYGIPYACLVARDLDNLLMAGRCISVTHEALGSTRISPVSMALGQAAGIAAALSSKEGKRPADVAAGAVQSHIVDQDGLI